MNISIYQDTVIVDEPIKLAESSSVVEHAIPGAATGVSIISVDPRVRLTGIRITPASARVTSRAGAAERVAVGAIVDREGTDSVKLYGRWEGSSPQAAAEMLTIRSDNFTISEAQDMQRISCQVEVDAGYKRDAQAPIRVGYRMPRLSWQFQHEMTLFINKNQASLTSNIRLETSSLPATPSAKLVFSAKALGRIESDEGVPVRRYAMTNRPRDRSLESEESGLDMESDMFGSWTIENVSISRFSTLIYPVGTKKISDVRYRLIYYPSGDHIAVARSPRAYLDLCAPKAREQIAKIETGRLILRASPGHLISDALTLASTARRISLGMLQSILIEETQTRDDHVEKWHEVRLTITNKSSDAMPVPLEIWHQSAKKIVVQLSDTVWSDVYMSDTDPVDNSGVCRFPIDLAPKKPITVVVFRWYYH